MPVAHSVKKYRVKKKEWSAQRTLQNQAVLRFLEIWRFVVRNRVRCEAVIVWSLVFGCFVSNVISDVYSEENPLLVAPTEARSAAEQLRGFHLPPGFEIQLIAAEPEIRKPINMNFDARGDLYVTESVEYPFAAAADVPSRDVIKCFADSDGDGVPDKMHVAVENLNIPIGVLPLGKRVIGHSIPAIQEFTDSDGDGKAESRKTLYGDFGYRDTHGMASSFNYWIDGWVYACHGFSNDSEVRGEDGKQIQMNSGNTYRFRPDGSHIEYFTHGQVNPFGMAIDPLGNVFTADCHSRPIYQLLRGAWYPSFGKPHDGLGYGPEMIKHDHGSTGICGVVYYGADQFPGEYRETVLIGNPVTGRINHDRLAQSGSTFTAVEQPDFLYCDDPWFRPVDIKLAPDGSIYVADFYNRIIGHYEVSLQHPGRDRERGRIWRIVYRGKPTEKVVAPRSMPDLVKLSLQGLVERLRDSNLVVRTLATQQLVERLQSDESVLKANEVGLQRLVLESDSPEQRVGLLWALERLHLLEEDSLLRLAKHPARLVRVQVQKVLAERTELTVLRGVVQQGLVDEDAFVRRAAADALGRHPDLGNVALLLKLWEGADLQDTHLIHVVRMALRDSLRGIPDWSVIPAIVRTSPRFLEICMGISEERGSQTLLEGMIQGKPEDRRPDFWYHIARFGDEAAIKRMVELFTKESLEDRSQKFFSIRAIARGLREHDVALLQELRQPGIELIRTQLSEKNPVSRQGAAEVGIELDLRETIGEFETELKSTSLRDEGWSWLAEAMIVLNPERAVVALTDKLRDVTAPPDQRQRVADLLGRVNRPAAREILLQQFLLVPQEVALSIARSLSANRDGAEALLSLVSAGKASATLLQDTVVQQRVKASGLPEVEQRVTDLLKDLPAVDQRILDLIAARKEHHRKGEWDAEKGGEVFQKNCGSCHRLGGKGAKIGPELDGIGIRGLDRILEDTLNPNGNVDQAFRATVFAMNDGRVVSGLLLRQEGEVYVIADEKGQEQRLTVRDVDEKKQHLLSPMPADVAEKLPEAEFQNLMAFLLKSAQKPVAPVEASAK